MNFRNYTNEELTTYICNQPNRNKFINAAKELTTRVVEGRFISESQCEARCEAAYERGIQASQREAREAGFEEGYQRGFDAGYNNKA